jgi:Tfp pilus assembly protein PilF
VQTAIVSTPVAQNHFAQAMYYQRIADFDNALTHYRALLDQNDASVEGHNNLGLLYLDHGRPDDAVREFQRAIALDPRHVTAHNNLGVAYMRQNRPDNAAAEFRVALAAAPRNVESIVNLALVGEVVGPDGRRARPAAARRDDRSPQRRLALQPGGPRRRGRRERRRDRTLSGVPEVRVRRSQRSRREGSREADRALRLTL